MARKYEVKAEGNASWLQMEFMERIAVFCEALGAVADRSGRPLVLKLTIQPEERKCHKLPRLPCN